VAEIGEFLGVYAGSCCIMSLSEWVSELSELGVAGSIPGLFLGKVMICV
jgi:hypothetical protein